MIGIFVQHFTHFISWVQLLPRWATTFASSGSSEVTMTQAKIPFRGTAERAVLYRTLTVVYHLKDSVACMSTVLFLALGSEVSVMIGILDSSPH